MNDKNLMEMAKKASGNSYSPYSKFQVGAALLTKDNSVITGCNVENISYGLSMCAERVAIFKAICKGKKKGDFLKIAIAGKPHKGEWQFCTPCGACRQVIYELVQKGQRLDVIYLDMEKNLKTSPINDLLPDKF